MTVGGAWPASLSLGALQLVRDRRAVVAGQVVAAPFGQSRNGEARVDSQGTEPAESMTPSRASSAIAQPTLGWPVTRFRPSNSFQSGFWR